MERHPESASSPGFPADPTAAQPAPPRNWLHRAVNVAVAVVVIAVAAGTFFLSYPGVHAVALQAGVSPQLARIYPGLFDAVLVIACVAAVMLRYARWWARAWAWVVLIVVLAATGATDVLHAMSYGLQKRPTEGVIAAAPVAAVLLAFSLFLTMLRQSRPQPAPAAAPAQPQAPADSRPADQQPTAPMVFTAADTVPVLAAGAVPRPPAPPIALPAAPADSTSQPAADTERRPAAPVADAGAREATPTQLMPVVAADWDDPGDRGTAVTREEPALATNGPSPTGPEPTEAAAEAEPTAPESNRPRSTGPEWSGPESTSPESTSPESTGAEAEARSVEAEPADREPTGRAEQPATEPRPIAQPAAPVAAATAPPPSADLTANPAAGAPADLDQRAETEHERAPEPATTPRPHTIRYASSAAAEQFGDEDWEAEVDPALAGQVYPVLTSDPDIEVPAHQPGDPQDLEDDAPPFATAPFASVPRLNRARVTPTPPTDDRNEE